MSLAFGMQGMRRAPREEVSHRCEIEGPQHDRFIALIVNISSCGCMVRCNQEVEPGTMLDIGLPVAGDVRGEVIWSMAGRMGIEFVEDIRVAPYCAMLDRLSRNDSDLGLY